MKNYNPTHTPKLIALGGALLMVSASVGGCVGTRTRMVEKREVTEASVPELKSPEKGKTAIAFVSTELKDGVRFETGSAKIVPEFEALLLRLSVLLKQNPDERLRLDGFADSQGATEFNRELSQKRAAAVREVLLADGVNPEQIYANAHGEDHPIASNESPEGRALNRRVEFTIEIA